MAVLKIYDDIANENDAYGFFGDKQDVFSASRLKDFIGSIEESDGEINGVLHCRGGSVTEGYACSDILRMSGKKITMTVEGLCASIATVILLSAPKENRKMYPHAQLLIHNPFIPPYTLADAYESEDLKKLAEDLEKEEVKLLDFYVERTGSDREELKTLMDAETYLTPEEALRLGFVSEITKPISNKLNYFSKLNSIMDERTKQEFEAKLKTQESILNKILKAVGLKSTGDKLAMDVTTSDGKTISIERESGDPQVGDKATPDGTFLMPEGNTIIVEGGQITEIQPAEDMEAMKAELTALRTENQSLKDAQTSLENSIAEAKGAGVKAQALYNELKVIQSKYVPEKRKESFTEAKTSAEARLSERLEKAKNRKK